MYRVTLPVTYKCPQMDKIIFLRTLFGNYLNNRLDCVIITDLDMGDQKPTDPADPEKYNQQYRYCNVVVHAEFIIFHFCADWRKHRLFPRLLNSNLWGFEGIVCREVDGEEKYSTLVWTVWRSHNCGLKYVIANYNICQHTGIKQGLQME
jgi:hypothetical protein